MTWDYDLLLINPPSLLDFNQSEGNYFSSKMKIVAMNPGLLSIATYIKKKKYSVKIVDLSTSSDYSFLEKELETAKPKIIGISSTSAFDYLESIRCIKISKSLSPNSLVIVGGQHAGPLGRVIFKDAPELDVLCKYEGEKVVEMLIRVRAIYELNNIPGIIYKIDNQLYDSIGEVEFVNLDEISPLDYEIYPNYLNFKPFIEESRGCPFGCSYCTSKYINTKKYRIKSAVNFLKEIEYAINLWGTKTDYAFLAANFGMNVRNSLKITEGLKKLNIKWSTEFRADSRLKDDYLYQLYESGLSVLNIGMESASPTILKIMNKTKNPNKYIRSMECLIKEASVFKNLALRINFIFYIGETPQTVRETFGFLCRNFEGIDSILYKPVFIVHGTELFKYFEDYKYKYGCSLYSTQYWEKRHLKLCNPSGYFSFEEVMHFCNMGEKIFSTRKGWIKNEALHIGSLFS